MSSYLLSFVLNSNVRELVGLNPPPVENENFLLDSGGDAERDGSWSRSVSSLWPFCMSARQPETLSDSRLCYISAFIVTAGQLKGAEMCDNLIPSVFHRVRVHVWAFARGQLHGCQRSWWTEMTAPKHPAGSCAASTPCRTNRDAATSADWNCLRICYEATLRDCWYSCKLRFLCSCHDYS